MPAWACRCTSAQAVQQYCTSRHSRQRRSGPPATEPAAATAAAGLPLRAPQPLEQDSSDGGTDAAGRWPRGTDPEEWPAPARSPDTPAECVAEDPSDGGTDPEAISTLRPPSPAGMLVRGAADAPLATVTAPLPPPPPRRRHSVRSCAVSGQEGSAMRRISSKPRVRSAANAESAVSPSHSCTHMHSNDSVHVPCPKAC